MYIIPEWDMVMSGKKTVAEAAASFVGKVDRLIKGVKNY
jgi:hypothetical protein